VVLAPGLAVATGVQSVVGLDPQTGSVLWSVDRATGPLVVPAIEQGSATSPGVIVYSEGTGATSGIQALDLATHTRKWRVSLTAPALGAPVIMDGRVFAGVSDSSVVSIDITSGSVAWTAHTDAIVATSPAVGDGKVFAVSEDASSGRARVYALDELTGKVDWTYSPGHFATHVSAPSFADGRVFAGLGDQTVASLRSSDGKLMWSAPVRSNFSAESTPAIANGTVFIADVEGDLYAIDERSGARRWDYQFASLVIHGSPLVAGGIVYLGLEDGELAAIRATSGHLVWRTVFSIGAIGPLTPDGDLLLAPAIGVKGGVIGLRHDPSAPLSDAPSPTHLRLGLALANFAGAFLLVLALAAVAYRYAGRRPSTDENPLEAQ
jgi:outer membrane protein assembly factor BamB